MTRPLIGVTVSRRSGWRVFPLLALNVWLAGGRAVRWQGADRVDIDRVDGVIIGGGDDIAPTLYGGDMRLAARLDEGRDALEKWILGAAFDRGIPVLGICRGSQMMNVVLGGGLHQDAFGHYRARKRQTILPRRRVQVEPDSRLSGIVGHSALNVNTLHSQSVARVGRGLRVAARDDYGMVQAVERVRDPFAVGVQWHPELLIYKARHRALFRALVTAAHAFFRERAQIESLDRHIARSGEVLDHQPG